MRKWNQEVVRERLMGGGFRQAAYRHTSFIKKCFYPKMAAPNTALPIYPFHDFTLRG